MTTRGRKLKPGRITFVGAGPGDPGLLTTRARTVLAHAALVFTDPDVPEAVLALVGSDLPPASGPAEAAKTDDATDADGAPALSLPSGVEVRPALGDPAEVAKVLANEARTGVDVVRLVAGDPLSDDAVITEVTALARAHGQFEIVPGLPPTTAVPTYAGLPLGSSHTVADVRGDVDWAALAAAPGPLILDATASHLPEAARTLIEYGLTESTPCVVTANGTTCQQRSVEVTLAGLLDKATLAAPDPAGRSVGRASPSWSSTRCSSTGTAGSPPRPPSPPPPRPRRPFDWLDGRAALTSASTTRSPTARPVSTWAKPPPTAPTVTARVVVPLPVRTCTCPVPDCTPARAETGTRTASGAWPTVMATDATDPLAIDRGGVGTTIVAG